MKTIASEVLDYIKTKPFLMSALSQGIINLTSLAREIQPDIEKSLKKSAKSGAIVMALKRISDNQEFLSTHKIVRVLKNLGDITVRSSLADYCFKITDTLLLSQAKFLDQIKSEPNAFYTSSRGVAECNIIVSQNLIDTVDTIFQSEFCLDKEVNLSAITVKLPTDNVQIPGIYYFIFHRFCRININKNCHRIWDCFYNCTTFRCSNI